METDNKIPQIIIYKDILRIGVPAFIGALCFAAIESINLIFVGTLNDASIVAGLGVGRVFINIFGMITLSGFNTALLTLVS